MTKFSVFTPLFLSLLLLLRGFFVRAENPKARECRLSNALSSSSFCRLLNNALFFFFFFFVQKKEAQQNRNNKERAEIKLLFCGKTQKFFWRQFFCKRVKKEEKFLSLEKGATQKKHRPKITRHVLHRKKDDDVYILRLDDDAHDERSALLPPLRLLL